MCARVPTRDMSVARPRTNAQRACAVATYDLGTYERSHRLTLGGRSALRIQGVLLSNHRGISCAPCRCRPRPTGAAPGSSWSGAAPPTSRARAQSHMRATARGAGEWATGVTAGRHAPGTCQVITKRSPHDAQAIPVRLLLLPGGQGGRPQRHPPRKHLVSPGARRLKKSDGSTIEEERCPPTRRRSFLAPMDAQSCFATASTFGLCSKRWSVLVPYDLWKRLVPYDLWTL